MNYTPVNFEKKFGKFEEHWNPKIVARMNNDHFKLVKIAGDFVWHKHSDTDEAFIVIRGEMRIDFRDGGVALKAGEMFVVPKGADHKPYADAECHIMIIEPAETLNTGDAGGEMTVEQSDWI